ncbi:MAG: glycogen debranching protein GlgX [Gammaproteobacteria bacterium]
MIEKGCPDTLGAECDPGGTNFAIFSSGADRAELCLFNSNGQETQRLELAECTDGVWHGYLPGCRHGQRYGYRFHGRYAPDEGLRFNCNKLLIDPYARELSGEFRWSPAVFDFELEHDTMLIYVADSANWIPNCVVSDKRPRAAESSPGIPWSEAIVYEANVRGYTMRHPGLTEKERGTFRGMANGKILSYLKSLGITSIELMPVHAFIDEAFLVRRGLRNFWGYNTINFFTPAHRYAVSDPCEEFRNMVNAIHDAGMEVLLDVAYNHTGESDAFGPTISFRGIDNQCYYRTLPEKPAEYINDTGCGNTVNTDHARVRALILDSLRFWASEMGVDGFRFDLATTIGRDVNGFNSQHPLLQAIEDDALLSKLKFIAEPWDIGPDGYQLGNFSSQWAEWNDKYRDSVRRYWRGDRGETAEFAKRLHGSSDIFEGGGKRPWTSVNLLTAHDGFTLSDVVSYETKHNQANGENNRDGHSHNFSSNCGVEGATEDPTINLIRRRRRLNMLASLLMSQGTPMLLAGDEFGNSQQGNNNAYAQDNETGWLDWTGLSVDQDFKALVIRLIWLRKSIPLLRQDGYLHGQVTNYRGWRNIDWIRPDGDAMQPQDWDDCRAISVLLTHQSPASTHDVWAVAILFNGSEESQEFLLPGHEDHLFWQLGFTSASDAVQDEYGSRIRISADSIALMTHSPSIAAIS